MEQGYEKRLLGSPYKSPIKPLSPMTTPTKENYLDRYIPSRSNARWKNPSSFELTKDPCMPLFQSFSSNYQDDGVDRDTVSDSPHATNASSSIPGASNGLSTSNSNSSIRQDSSDSLLTSSQQIDIVPTLVHNELVDPTESNSCGLGSGNSSSDTILASRENSNIFSYKIRKESPCKLKSSPYTLSPVSEKSQRLLQCPQKYNRQIPRMPYKVLDAPELQDDFYLNLVDWSSQNILAVGLGTCVYLWNAYTSLVTRLCDFADEADAISSVAWTKKGTHLAVATYRGRVHIWDVAAGQCLRRLEGHLARVGALAWNSDLLASGSRDRQILLRDVRASPSSGGGLTYTPRPSSDAPALLSSVHRPALGRHQLAPAADDPAEESDNEEGADAEAAVSLSHTEATTDTSATLTPPPQPSTTVPGSPNPTPATAANGYVVIDRDILASSTRAGLIRSSAASIFDGSTAVAPGYSDFNSCPGSVRVLKDHRQEVCGLKWSPDNQYLASGGNDNRLLVWSQHVKSFASPVLAYEEHLAAVKAISWSPHQHGLLASGGGTADRCIRFWNTLTGQALRSVETESQVCNLAWSIHSNELVSTHGYSQNQILVWRYPSLTQLAKLTGHSYRVLYLAVSPDGENIVTGAGDETLRFWNVFCRVKAPKPHPSSLNLFSAIR
nr:unnamed protein product [Spirometra erinaceieuropaei]